MYHLAEHLGQPLSTILEMTVDEYQYWYSYLKVKQERQEKSQRK